MGCNPRHSRYSHCHGCRYPQQARAGDDLVHHSHRRDPSRRRLFTELWFDEICSIDYVQSTHSAWQALWSIHTDNKHHLIWLWIWVIGPHLPDLCYRIPSFIAGVTLLPLLYRVVRIEWNQTACHDCTAAGDLLLPVDFLFVRSPRVSLAVLAAMAAYTLAPDRLRKTSLTRALLFSAVLVLGSCHISRSFTFYAGLIAWALIELIETRRWTALAYHLPAVAHSADLFFRRAETPVRWRAGDNCNRCHSIHHRHDHRMPDRWNLALDWRRGHHPPRRAWAGDLLSQIPSRPQRVLRYRFNCCTCRTDRRAKKPISRNAILPGAFPFLLLLISIGLSSILRTCGENNLTRVAGRIHPQRRPQHKKSANHRPRSCSRLPDANER